MARSTRVVKRAIIAHLEQHGTATPKEIAQALGPEWQEQPKRVLLRQLLRRMVGQRLLRNPPGTYGVYALSPLYRLKGLDAKDALENALEDFLRERGGVATTTEIHKAFSERRWGDPDGYERRQVALALTGSPRFQQDFGRGAWNLIPTELERLPLIGRWANRRIMREWDPKWSVFEHWFDERESWFAQVGAAFAQARGDMPIEKVASLPAIRAMLGEMAPSGSAALADALDEIRWKVETEGAPDGSTVSLATREQKPALLPVVLLKAFEAGSVNLHIAAPAEFYRACAVLFGVCPVMLSRGAVERVP